MPSKDVVRMAEEDEKARLVHKPQPDRKPKPVQPAAIIPAPKPQSAKLPLPPIPAPRVTHTKKTDKRKNRESSADRSCKYCQGRNVVKRGIHKNIQQYVCYDCNRKFSDLCGIPGSKTDERIITRTIALFDEGRSYRQIQEVLRQEFDARPSNSSIRAWIARCRQIPENFQAAQSLKRWQEQPYRRVLNSLTALGTAFAQKPCLMNDQWMEDNLEEWEKVNDQIIDLVRQWLKDEPVLFVNTVLNREAIKTPEEITDLLSDDIWGAAIDMIWDQYDKLRPGR